MYSRRHFIFGSSAAIALAGCGVTRREVAWALTFVDLDPIIFNADSVEVVDLYQPPLSSPNVEHAFPISPATATRASARQRIKAGGSQGSITVKIINASVVAVPLPTTRGFVGLLFDQQAIRYEASLEITLEYQGPLAIESSARSIVSRSRTVPESITLNELDNVFYGLLKGLMEDLDEQINLAISQSLKQLVL